MVMDNLLFSVTAAEYGGVGAKPVELRPQRKSAVTCAPC